MNDPTIWRWLPVAMIVVAVGTAAGIWKLAKEIRRTWRRGDMTTTLTGLTWVCHVCEEERPDHMIAVFKVDVSEHFKLPPGMAFNNVRHCVDRPDCISGAEKIRWVPPLADDEEVRT